MKSKLRNQNRSEESNNKKLFLTLIKFTYKFIKQTIQTKRELKSLAKHPYFYFILISN